MIVLTGQAVVEAAPNVIYVREVVWSMPEWVRIVISAAVGAVFGIGGNIAMEFLKPRMAKAALKKMIATQLIHEMKKNLTVVSELSLKLSEPSTTAAHLICASVLQADEHLRWDRYTFYLENERSAIYEMDPQGSMNTLLKIPPQMDELSRRHKFPEVYAKVKGYIERSNAMIDALTNAPTEPILIDD